MFIYLLKTTQMTRFEYKTVNVPMARKNSFSIYKFDRTELDQILRKLGEQGWELVSTLDNTAGGSMMEIVMVFKRAVG